MQRGGEDVFEDFPSDSDGSEHDDSDASDDFDDEHIANVLELMGEDRVGPSATLPVSAGIDEGNSAGLSVSATDVFSSDVATGAIPTPTHTSSSAQIASTLARVTVDVPSALTLLDELFPSLDLLTEPLEGDLTSTRPASNSHNRPDMPSRSPQSSLAALLVQHTSSSSAPSGRGVSLMNRTKELPELLLAVEPPHSPTYHQTTRSDQDEQPEWMRELLDEMHKQSTSSPAASSKPPSAPIPATGPRRYDQDTGTVDGGERVPDAQSAPLQSVRAATSSITQEELKAAPSSGLLPQPSDDPTVLEIDTTPRIHSVSLHERTTDEAPSVASSLDGTVSSSSLAWGKFVPDKMPVRRSPKTLRVVASAGNKSSNGESKRLCYVPILRAQKRRLRPPADAELTFRPTINTRYLTCVPDPNAACTVDSADLHALPTCLHFVFHSRLRGRRRALADAFSRRMASDIQQRQERQLERARSLAERTKVQSDAEQQARRTSLVAKGSARILQQNGRWAEPLEQRLVRLGTAAQSHRGSKPTTSKSREKSRLRQQRRRERAEAVASRACESLYQRGLDKQRRDERREHESAETLRRLRMRCKMTVQSQLVVKNKLRTELALVCARQRERVGGAGGVDPPSCRVTFVEFSCALLYFGLVPTLDTRWRDGDGDVTTLWHAWRSFVTPLCAASDTTSESMEEEETMAMSTLETLLARVMRLDEMRNESDGHPRQLKLLQQLRTNYLSRSRTQTLEVRRMYDNDAASASPAKPTKASPSRSVRARTRQRTYSLHGKPDVAAPDGSTRKDLLTQRQEATTAKLSALRRERDEHEVAECTFQPRLSTASGTRTLVSAADAFNRLYHDAFERQNSVLDKYFQAKREDDERRQRLAAVAPSVVHGKSVDERLRSLHNALARTPLPVHFHHKIDEMRAARVRKAHEQDAQAQRLRPAQFARSVDGRTLVTPFQFATDVRASQPPRLRSKSDRMRRGKAAVDAVRSCQQAHQPQFKAEEEDDGADVWLDVHLSPTCVQRLCFHAHDDPDAVSAAFATRVGGLSAAQQRDLADCVRALVDELVERRT